MGSAWHIPYRCLGFTAIVGVERLSQSEAYVSSAKCNFEHIQSEMICHDEDHLILEVGRLLKVVAIVQARMNSSPFPGKVMKRVVGMIIIELLLRRLRHSKMIDAIVVATSQEPETWFDVITLRILV